jgi:primosomal protein N' (replication factor Y)
VRVLGPAVAPNARLKRIYRYHLVLKSDRRDILGMALREMLAFIDREEIPRRSVLVDVDPMHLM